MTTPFDGNADPEQQDRLLHTLQEEQQRGRKRARRLMKDYRDFFKAAPAAPSGILFGGDRAQPEKA